MSAESKQISSSTWYQEFRPCVNDQRVRWEALTLSFGEYDTLKLTLDYEYSWLIGDEDALICLEYEPGHEGQGMVFDPPLGQLCKMEDGTTSLSWTITADNPPSGSFVVQFSMPKLNGMPKSPPVQVETINFAQELAISFDTFALDFGGKCYPCIGTRHQLHILPKPSSKLLNKSIRLFMGGADLGVTVDPPLVQEPLLTDEGVVWTLDCSKGTRGDFFMKVELVDSKLIAMPLNMSLGHNLVTAERWSDYVVPGRPGMDPYTQYSICATSSFLSLPVPGVRVMVNFNNGNTTWESTNNSGEVTLADHRQTFKRFEITNLYDGSIV
jgi:hypothetical protein